MFHDYNTRTKKKSVVSNDCLQTLEANIINNINRLKDEIISLKDTVIKRLQEENERLRDKCQQLENRVLSNRLMILLSNTVKKIPTLWPLFMDRVQLPQG